MKLEQATRSNSSMRLAIHGCSGGGKTYSALQLAKGLTKNNQIAVIDTEAGSAALYSNLTSFKVLRLEQPFTPERFIEAITICENAGCDVIREEKVSGTSLKGRVELETLMEFMRDGDELVVTRIDRLARSIRDLQNIVHKLKKKGVTLSATEQPIDTKTSAGKAFLDMLGVFSEFETNLRNERQLEGVRKAKERGVYKGRIRTIDANQIHALKQSGLGATKISKELGITRQSVYRLLKEQPVSIAS